MTTTRKTEPIQYIAVDEEPTMCIYCDTRTTWGGAVWPATRARYECCPVCEQRYHVEDEET